MGERRVGLLVNPIAGMGGRVGLKGTDGLETLHLAIEMGARPEAVYRASRTLSLLRRLASEAELITLPGAMGEDAARLAGVEAKVIGEMASGETSAEDTRRATNELVQEGLELLLFAGGDGTARDVMSALGADVPVLGIPAGCKMHSGVFATSPDSAARLTALFLQSASGGFPLREAEVMDIDEEAFREDRVSARLYGYLRVPYDRRLVQGAKTGRGRSEEAALAAIAQDFRRTITDGCLYLFGGGSTTGYIVSQLGLEKTLLGVDAVLDGRVVAKDVNEAQILQMIAGKGFRIVVSVIGRQGYVFGRGNQQISAEVIKQTQRENVIVVATMEKLAGLPERRLLVDTGDPEVDKWLSGYLTVHTGYGQRVVMPVSA